MSSLAFQLVNDSASRARSSKIQSNIKETSCKPHVNLMQVTNILDGDTFELGEMGEIRARLCAVDAPELGQLFGEASKKWLNDYLPIGCEPDIITQYWDKYDRMVVEVEHDGILINEEIVRWGLAWVDPLYVTWVNDPNALSRAQREAEINFRGVHSEPSCIPPWAYRNRYKEWSDFKNQVREVAITKGIKNPNQLAVICHLPRTTAYRIWNDCYVFPCRQTLINLCGGLDVELGELLSKRK